jgi:hypothetical protein
MTAFTFTELLLIQITSMLQRPKYNNREPDPIEFFGECMTSPKNGRSPLASQVYVS